MTGKACLKACIADWNYLVALVHCWEVTADGEEAEADIEAPEDADSQDEDANKGNT